MQNESIEYKELYKYVKENLGTGNIEFHTKVTEEEFQRYLKEYPAKVESNAFMGYVDYYDFSKKEEKTSHYNYMIARHYIDYGADDYLLPTITG